MSRHDTQEKHKHEKLEGLPFLQIDDLVVEYISDGEIVHAVNGVSLKLEKGKTLGLVGETGAGKTTIAKSILRILPDVGAKITGGQIHLDGEDVLALSEKEMRRIRGNVASMIFQDPMTALNPVMRVGEQIAEVVALHSEDHNHAHHVERAKEMLEVVGIPAERYYEYPHQFSGGMKQRVVIAIALACNPDLLLADEPTTALDVTIQAQVMDLIGDLQKKFNTAMLLITHDMGVVATVCDDVAVIYAGNIVEYGTKEQIFDHPTHPYTIGLMASKPVVGKQVDKLYSIPGKVPNPIDMPNYCYFKDRCEMCVAGCEGDYPCQVQLSPTHFVSCYRYYDHKNQGGEG